MGTALLYIRCRKGHCDGCVKFEFNNIKLLCTKNGQNSGQRLFVSLYIAIIIFYDTIYF